MTFLHAADAFGRGDQIDQPDMFRALLGQQIERGHGAAAGRQHRINQNDFEAAEVFRETFVVKLRAQRRFFPFEADETDAGGGINCKMESNMPSPARNTGTSATSRSSRRPCALASGVSTETARTANIARRFVKHERGDFAEQPAEFLRLRPFVAQPGEVVLHQRVRDDGDAFHVSSSAWATGSKVARPPTWAGSCRDRV